MGTTTITREYKKRIFKSQCAESILWKNAVLAGGGSVTDAQLAQVDTFNAAIRKAGIKLDRCWLFSGMLSSVQATYDVITGSAFTFGGTGSFSARWSQNNGYHGNESDNFLNSNFTPRTAGGNYQIGNCMACVHINNARSSFNTGNAIGSTDGTDACQLLPFFFTGPNMNINGAQPNPTAADSRSIIIGAKTSETTAKGYSYKSASPTTATSSFASNSPLLNQPIYIGSYNSSGTASLPSIDDIGAAMFGASVNDAQADALAAAINAFMASGGATFSY